MRILLGALLVLWALPLRPAFADALIEEHQPLTVEFAQGTAQLEAIIVKPDRPGRLPVALITHGSPRDRAARATMTSDRMLPQARDLAHRGWLAVAIFRRGFAHSEGPFVEGYDCRHPDYGRALRIASDDLDAALRAVSRRTDADGSRVLGIGVSVGGAAMLTFAARHPRGLAAVVNVSGGTGAYATGKNCDADRLVEHFAEIGKEVRIPTLWLYAANDSYFNPEIVQRLFDAFTASGGTADLHRFGPLTSDGHELWARSEGRKQWLPELDRFLRAHDLPSWDRAPSQTLAARLSPAARRVFAAYLDAASEKAFALSPSGAAAYWSATNSIAAARAGALRECQNFGGARCTVVMEDFATAAPR